MSSMAARAIPNATAATSAAAVATVTNGVHYTDAGAERDGIAFTPQKGSLPDHVEIVEREPMRVLFMRHVGPYSDCGDTWQKLMGYGFPRGLIGPMSDGKNVIRYESPEVFETLTKEWSTSKAPKKTRRRTARASESTKS